MCSNILDIVDLIFSKNFDLALSIWSSKEKDFLQQLKDSAPMCFRALGSFFVFRMDTYAILIDSDYDGEVVFKADLSCGWSDLDVQIVNKMKVDTLHLYNGYIDVSKISFEARNFIFESCVLTKSGEPCVLPRLKQVSIRYGSFETDAIIRHFAYGKDVAKKLFPNALIV